MTRIYHAPEHARQQLILGKHRLCCGDILVDIVVLRISMHTLPL